MLHVITAAVTVIGSPAPAGAMPDDFGTSLQTPMELGDVDVVLGTSDGINLEISFELAKVGRVLVAVHGDDEGSGVGLVTIDNAMVAEVDSVDGVVIREWADLTGLRSTQVHDVAAGIVQIWREDVVTGALRAASRDGKCDVAGKIAGASTATLVAAGCFLLWKKKWCGGAGAAVYNKVSGWISDKCNGAQNG